MSEVQKIELKDLDVDKLVEQVTDEVDKLVKSEVAKMEEEKKKAISAQAPATELKKEEKSSDDSEKSKESSKLEKDGASYESQSPEASQPSPDMSQEAPPSDDQSQQPQQELESIESMLGSLSDEMLHELYQKLKMELAGRMSSQEQPDQSQPSPDMSSQPSSESQPAPDMAMKSEIENLKGKLAKTESDFTQAQEQAKGLEKALETMADLMDKITNRPVTKAVTDIRNVQYVGKGDAELKKADAEMSEPDLKKAVIGITKDFKKWESLSKSERDAVKDYLFDNKRKPELLQIFSK